MPQRLLFTNLKENVEQFVIKIDTGTRETHIEDVQVRFCLKVVL